MKRWGFRICAFLLLGAIVNVAVAFALWLWGERPLSGTFEAIDYWQLRSSDTKDIAMWHRLARHDWPMAPQTKMHQTTFGMRYSKMTAVKNDFNAIETSSHEEWKLKAKDRLFFTIASTACGWPIPFASISEARVASGMPPKFSTWDDAWLIGRLRVPNGVELPGFTINTLFYAAVLMGLFAVPFALRRRRRIRRGLCPGCAYDLRGSASQTCPECGAAVRRSSSESATTS